MCLRIILALLRIRQIIFSITLVLSHNHPIGKSPINPTPIATPANEIDGILLARYLNPGKTATILNILKDL